MGKEFFEKILIMVDNEGSLYIIPADHESDWYKYFGSKYFHDLFDSAKVKRGLSQEELYRKRDTPVITVGGMKHSSVVNNEYTQMYKHFLLKEVK